MKSSPIAGGARLSLTADDALRTVLVLAREPRGTAVRADDIAAAIERRRTWILPTSPSGTLQ